MERATSPLLIAALTATLVACAANPPQPAPQRQPAQPAAAETAAPLASPDASPVVHASCEAAAAQAIAVLQPVGATVAGAVEECTSIGWSDELRDCYASGQTEADMAPCIERYEAEATAASLAELGATLTSSLAADQCYDAADVAKCQEACNDGFAWACVHVAFVAATDDIADEWLVRSCILGETLAYAAAADLPLSADERQREIEGGLTACKTLAAPLIADPALGDGSLYVHVEQACFIAVQLNDGSAATACSDFAQVADTFGEFDWATWAYEHACAADNDDACLMAQARV